VSDIRNQKIKYDLFLFNFMYKELNLFLHTSMTENVPNININMYIFIYMFLMNDYIIDLIAIR
jgi:hypothetical protein